MSSVPLFNRNYLEYDSWFEKNAAILQAEIRVLEALLPGGGEILEVGAGTGRFAVALGATYAVEPSRNMARVVKSRGCTVCQALGERLPFERERFDCVVLITVLCFVDNERPIIAECWRVIKRQGHLLIGMIDAQSQLGAVYEARKSSDTFYGAASFHSVEHTVSLVKAAGFEIAASRQTILGMPYQTPGWDDLRDKWGDGAFVGLLARKEEAR